MLKNKVLKLIHRLFVFNSHFLIKLFTPKGKLQLTPDNSNPR